MEKRLRIEKIVAEGYGLARDNGEIYLAKRVIPGELIKVIKTEKKKGINFVRSFEILEKSAVRRVPECRYFGLCGGCDFQHIPYVEQLRIKESILAETFKRIGKIQLERLSGYVYSNEWNYRFRARLHTENGVVGFKKEESADLVAVDTCQILTGSLNGMVAGLIKVLKELSSNNEFKQTLKAVELRTNLNEKTAGFLFIGVSGKGVRETSKLLLSEIKNEFEEIGIWISYSKTSAPGKGFKVVEGPYRLYSYYDRLSFGFSPLSFFQPNLRLAMEVYKKILSLLEFFNSKRVLNLFCGAGLLEVFGGEKYEFLGVEENRYAVEDAKINTFLNETKAEFLNTDARSVERIEEVDTVILNPPYKGAGEKLTRVISDAKTVSKVIYLSCNPATLARDISFFTKNGGFSLKDVFLIDFYPQTSHIEVLVSLFR